MNLLRRGREHDHEILRLAIPAFFALTAEPLYVLTDTAIVGHLGTPQLAGVAAASAVLLTGYSIFIFLAYGTTSTVARLLGAGAHRQAAEQAVQSLWLAFGIATALAIVVFPLAGPLLAIFTDDPDVRDYGLIYLRISVLGAPAMLLTLAGVGYLRGLQDTRRPLYVALVTAAVNLVLEVALIYGLGFGVGASAASTVVAQWLGAGAYLYWIRHAVREHGVSLRPDPAAIGGLSRIGAYLFIRTIALRGSLLVAVIAAARIGTVDLAAHEIAFQILMLLALALDAIAIAGQSLVGRLLGAGDARVAREAGDRMIALAVMVASVAGVIILAGSPVLPAVFSGDPAVQSLTGFLLILVALMQPLNGTVFALDGILIGAGDQRYLAFAMLGAAAVFIPAVVVVRALDLGIGWLWVCIAGLMAARCVPLAMRYRTGRWLVLGAPGVAEPTG